MARRTFHAADPSALLGYVLKMFPRLSETFILNEVLELEQQGLPLRIFSLKQPADPVCHGQTRAVRSPVTYLPEGAARGLWRIARGQLHAWRHHRRPWGQALRSVVRRAQTVGDRGPLMSFSQACCLSREVSGLRHLHAHYANVPAKIALLVHRLTGIPYSISTHAKDIFQDDPLASPKLQERLAHARFIIANSQFSAEHLRSALGDGAARVHTVYNGLDLQAFPLRAAAAKTPLVLGVGRLVEKKGFSDLVSAMALLKSRDVRCTCDLVGTGPLSSQLKEQIRTSGLGGKVRLLGPLPQEALREHYARAMVFALPCVRAADGDRDILPNALKEAMASGVPVLTTRMEGIEELVTDGVSGLLVAPGNPVELAARLELLLGDPGLRQRLAVQGRKVIEERFDRRSNFARLRTLLEEAAQSAAPSLAPIGPAAAPTIQVPAYDAHGLR